MKQLTLFFSLFAILLFAACKDDEQPHSDCFTVPNRIGLNLTILEGPTITLPAKISVFFKVQDDNGNPVGFLTEDNFLIYEKGINDACPRIISEFEAKRKISAKEQVFNHTTVLVLDLSGSVLENSLNELQQAAKTFIDEVIDTADASKKMGIWWFDGEDTLHVLEPPTSDPEALKDAIDDVFPGMSQDNSTDLYGAVIRAADEAEDILTEYQIQDIAAAASVVIFTDGRDRANRYLRQDAINAVNSSPQDITFFTIGVGEEIEVSDLTAIGRNGFAQAATVAQLSNIFKQVATLVANEANSYYLFEYCSPIRSGANNTLVIEVFEGNSTGYIEKVFDATGFTGGCQL